MQGGDVPCKQEVLYQEAFELRPWSVSGHVGFYISDFGEVLTSAIDAERSPCHVGSSSEEGQVEGRRNQGVPYQLII